MPTLGRFKSTLLVFLCLFFILEASDSFGQWLPGYQYRKQIDLQNTQWVGGPHTDFPVLIELNTDADLLARAQADGFDIVFTDSDGETLLSHEMEAFDGSGNYRAWVKVTLPS